jgi:transposase
MNMLTEDKLFMASRQELIDHIKKLQDLLQAKFSKMEELEFQLDWYKRQVHGTRSERFIPDDEIQVALDLGIEFPQEDKSPQKESISYSRNKNRKADNGKGHSRGTMPTHLPIEEKIIMPDIDVSGLKCIGYQESWHYEMDPGSLKVILEKRPKYARDNGEGIIIADLPPRMVEKGNAGPGLITQITVDKYVYHMPLDRQRKKFESEYKVHFPESWLCDIVRNVGFWITPVYIGHKKNLLKAIYLCADETPIPVLVKGKRKTHKGYFWIYYDPLHGIVIFDYQPTRSRAAPSEFLKDFKGVLQVDGYEGYSEIIARNGLVRAACMDHVRRKFEYALGNDQQRASYAIDNMQLWYSVERAAKENGLSLEERFAARVAQTVPSMKQFHEWMKIQLQDPDVAPKSAIGRALTYALNQWPYFNAFMTDPKVELSNIAAENKIRPIAIGRKNYMFCGSHDAAQRAAMIYSLIATAQNHNVDPRKYFNGLFTELPAAKSNEISKFLLPEWKNQL